MPIIHANVVWGMEYYPAIKKKKKEHTTNSFNYIGTSQKHDAKWNQTHTRKYYMISCIWNSRKN